MPKFTSKTTGVTIEVADDAAVPAPEADWEPGTGTKRRRRADTGTVPVQHDDKSGK